MVLLRKGEDVREARSPFVINSLKRQGYKEVDDAAQVRVVDETPEPVQIKVKTKKGGRKS